MKRLSKGQSKGLPTLLEILKILLPLLTLVLIGVIWGHSLMTGEASSNESSFIADLINRIFGSAISENFIRKTAHFCEYMLLGILCVCDMSLWKKRGILAFLSALYLCLLVSVVDESIQLFTAERSGMLFDVWLDHAGGLTGCVCAYIFCAQRR